MDINISIKEEETNSVCVNSSNDRDILYNEDDSHERIVSYYEDQNILESYFDKEGAEELRNLGVSLIDAKDVTNTILEQVSNQFNAKVLNKVDNKTDFPLDESSPPLDNSLSHVKNSNLSTDIKKESDETVEITISDEEYDISSGINKQFEIIDDSDDTVYLNRIKAKRRKCELNGNKTTLVTHEQNRNRLFIWEKIWKSLYHHQREGVLWMWDLYCNNHGGILADEMGLGKSVTVAAFIAAICITCNDYVDRLNTCTLKQEQDDNHSDKSTKFHPSSVDNNRSSKREDEYIKGLTCRELESYEDKSKKFLLVLPATLISHWIEVFNKWYYPIRVFLFHGKVESVIKSKLNKVIDKQNKSEILVITTYETLRRNFHLFKTVDWFYLILDEGHKIRNPDSGITLAVKSIETCNRLLLSGSPIQNDLKELWSLIDFVYPGRLGTLPIFEQQFVIPIKQAEFRNAMKAQRMRAFNCTKILQELIKSCILRRRKHELQNILNLPSQAEHVLFCTLTAVQYDVYCGCLDLLQANQLVKNKMYGITRYFSLLNILREVCNHPELLKLIKKDFTKYNKNSRRMCEYDDYEDESFDVESDFESDMSLKQTQEEDVTIESKNSCEGYLRNYVKRNVGLFSNVNGKDCGKYQALLSILKLWRTNGKNRALIFTQGVRTLKLLSKMLERDMNLKEGKDILNLDGSTPVNVRFSLVKQFNQDTSIFLFILTSRVGGVGLNIIGANRVILYDPWWNPMTDVQAKERCWRIGQKREVIVYRLITKDTIEERIFQRQLFKEFIAKQILMDPRSNAKLNLSNLNDLINKPKKPNNYKPNPKLVSKYLKNIRNIWGNRIGCRKDGNTYHSYFDKLTGIDDHEYHKYRGNEKKEYVNDELNLFGEITSDAKSEHNAIISILGDNGAGNLLTNDIGSSSFVEDYGEEGISLMNDICEVTDDLAKKSLEMINQSKIEIRNYNYGVPTWTGKSGRAGAPSSVILKNLKRQKMEESFVSIQGNSNNMDHSRSDLMSVCTNSNMLEPKWDEGFIRKKLIDYFVKREKLGIKTTTKNILDNFGEIVPDSHHGSFKKLLKQICVLIKSDKNLVSENIWVLRKEIFS